MEKIIEFMAKHYDPKCFLTRERYNFWHDMKPKPGETPNELAARIRQDGAACKFSAVKDPQDEAFRTRFICSINNEAVLEAIFKFNDDEVNFEKVIQIAVNVEEYAKVAKAQVYGSKGSPVDSIKWQKTKDQPKKDQTNSTYKCYRCNKKGHKANDCRLLDSVYNFCNKKGHIGAACRKKAQERSKQEVKWIIPKVDKVHSVSSKEAILQKLEVPLFIEEMEQKVELDTGCSANFLTEECLKRLGKPSLAKPKENSCQQVDISYLVQAALL